MDRGPAFSRRVLVPQVTVLDDLDESGDEGFLKSGDALLELRGEGIFTLEKLVYQLLHFGFFCHCGQIFLRLFFALYTQCHSAKRRRPSNAAYRGHGAASNVIGTSLETALLVSVWLSAALRAYPSTGSGHRSKPALPCPNSTAFIPLPW